MNAIRNEQLETSNISFPNLTSSLSRRAIPTVHGAGIVRQSGKKYAPLAQHIKRITVDHVKCSTNIWYLDLSSRIWC